MQHSYLSLHDAILLLFLKEGVHYYQVRHRKLGKKKWTAPLSHSLKLDARSMQHIIAKTGNPHNPDTHILETRDNLVKKKDS